MTFKVNEVGTIEGSDTFKIPVSDYLSPEAKSVYTEFLNHQYPVASDIKEYRLLLDEYLLPTLNK
ncbi:hypothetical protein J2W17_003886 [Pseudomonas lini]|uniref:hypothetical protein n=1 Tax=Pseudomonas lini TaxID=163011 RepID=UPI00278A2BED|nr:hypothetical protein [Pseudomonas lini]MDQ0124932.1 hypothetical protein [Pseudomonas lini]